MSPHRTASLLLATLLLPLTAASQAQTTSQLERENDRLRKELADLRQQCSTGGDSNRSPSGVEQRAGDLAVTVSSVRAGMPKGTSYRGEVTLTLQIRNTGPSPLTLNYKQHSFGLVDNHGHQYELDQEHSWLHYADSVKGIPMAGREQASTTNVLMPGASQRVMFIAERPFGKGQSPGDTFDLSVTFASFADRGQGRVDHLRDFPIAFVGLNRAPGIGMGAERMISPSIGPKSSETLERVIRSVLGN